jgi:hypothetical protein
MKTKTELLAKAASLGACADATLFVEAHDSECAIEIFRSCDREDWLCWLGGRVKPRLAVEYANWCAGRAKECAADAAYYAARAAAGAADAAHYTARAAAAAAGAAECKMQAAWWYDRAEEVLS